MFFLNPHYLRYRIPGWKRKEQMYVVRSNPHCLNLKTKISCDSLNQLLLISSFIRLRYLGA